MARCRKCQKRFNILDFLPKAPKIEASIKSKSEFEDDITEITEIVESTQLFTNISGITGLPVESTPLDAKFIDYEEIEPVLEIFGDQLSKLDIKTEDIKEIVIKLNKIALKRGWINKFGSGSDNKDETDLFFKIYEMVSNGIQNFLKKKEMDKNMKDLGTIIKQDNEKPKIDQQQPRTGS